MKLILVQVDATVYDFYAVSFKLFLLNHDTAKSEVARELTLAIYNFITRIFTAIRIPMQDIANSARGAWVANRFSNLSISDNFSLGDNCQEIENP